MPINGVMSSPLVIQEESVSRRRLATMNAGSRVMVSRMTVVGIPMRLIARPISIRSSEPRDITSIGSFTANRFRTPLSRKNMTCSDSPRERSGFSEAPRRRASPISLESLNALFTAMLWVMAPIQKSTLLRITSIGSSISLPS